MQLLRQEPCKSRLSTATTHLMKLMISRLNWTQATRASSEMPIVLPIVFGFWRIAERIMQFIDYWKQGLPFQLGGGGIDRRPSFQISIARCIHCIVHPRSFAASTAAIAGSEGSQLLTPVASRCSCISSRRWGMRFSSHSLRFLARSRRRASSAR